MPFAFSSFAFSSSRLLILIPADPTVTPYSGSTGRVTLPVTYVHHSEHVRLVSSLVIDSFYLSPSVGILSLSSLWIPTSLGLHSACTLYTLY